MSDLYLALSKWLVHSALGGGLILLLAWWLMRRVAQPAARQRLGEAGLAAALLVAVLAWLPSWLVVPWGVSETTIVATAAPQSPPAVAPLPEMVEAPLPLEVQEAPIDLPVAGVEPAGVLVAPWPWHAWVAVSLLVLYLSVVVGLLLRLGLGYLALAQLLRQTCPAPDEMRDVLNRCSGRSDWPRLLLSFLLRVPVSCGLWRPTIVLPVGLCRESEREKLDWVLAHELTHLRRRDAWSCLLQGLAAAVFFYLPWCWAIRRQIQLCQEYVADAAAVPGQEKRTDYAEFLLSLAPHPAIPAGATGVSGGNSDLYRRVTMLLQTPTEKRAGYSRRWLLTCCAALVALAVIVSGVGLRADPPRIIIIEKDGPKKDDKAAPRVLILTDDGKVERQGVIVIEKDGRLEVKVLGDKVQPKDGKGQFEIELKLGPKEIESLKKFRFEKRIPEDVLKLKGVDLDPRDIEKLLEQLKDVPGVDVEKIRDLIKKGMEGAKKGQPQIEFDLRGFEWRDLMKKGDEAKKWRGGWFKEKPDFTVPLTGKADRARLGLELEKPGELIVEQMGLPKGQGLVVTKVQEKTPAAKAGFKVNDILLELAGSPVPSDSDKLTKIVEGLKSDSKTKAVVLRKGKRETISDIEVGSAPKRDGIRFWDFKPGEFRFPGGGDNQAFTTTIREGDRVTIRHQEGGLSITLTGTVEEGKAKLTQARIRDGKDENTYDSVQQVPERYRERVNQLLQLSSGGPLRSDKK